MTKRVIATKISAAAVLMMMLTACGNSKSDRRAERRWYRRRCRCCRHALTGGNVGTGALVGGAVGWCRRWMTNSSQLNLGKPAWR